MRPYNMPVRSRAAMPDIYAYTDYRKYLRDAFASRKRENPRFSYGAFGKRAGIPRNHLGRVLDGRLNLASSRIGAYAQGLGLSAVEAGYFRALAHRAHAKTEGGREAADREMRRLKGYRQQRQADPSRFFDDPASPLLQGMIFSMRKLSGFKADPSWISRRLRGRVSEAQVRDALHLMVRKGLLRFRRGRLVRTAPPVFSAKDFPDRGRGLFHQTQDLLQDFSEDCRTETSFAILHPGEIPHLIQRYLDWRMEHVGIPAWGKKGEMYLMAYTLVPLTSSRD